MKKGNEQKILRPGKVLYEDLQKIGLSQKELALRTGVSEKHIWTIINDDRPISLAFSKKLDYVFSDLHKEDGYYYNLQQMYDIEKHNIEEKNDIDDEEKNIYKQLKEPIEYILKRGQDFITESMDQIDSIIGLRKFLCISNLKLMSNSTQKIAFRMSKSSNISINQNIMYMWIRICEHYGSAIDCNGKQLDIEKLKSIIPNIRSLMSKNLVNVKGELQHLFSACGIRFDIVKHFKGSPGQGFIKLLNDGSCLMCITIRGGRADVFWFTLFHEIAHLLNGDIVDKRIDIQGNIDEKETKADELAQELILKKDIYKEFIDRGNFSENAINTFASNNDIPTFMVIGRMQKEQILGYNEFYEKIPIYHWVEG